MGDFWIVQSDKRLVLYLPDTFSRQLEITFQGLRVYVNGIAAINSALNEKITKDLALAEGISVPLIFLLLLFVFGGLIASATPLIVGVGAIIGSLGIIYLISLVTGVSIFALNLITGMGLGLGIDYALLVVNRFREELHHGQDVESAIVNTVRTAGKTVFYSGLTVFITLASLTFFPLMFLKSFGYAGMSVVAVAVLVALLPFPAILAMMGTRIDSLVIRKSAVTPKSDGRWAQTARFVMRRLVHKYPHHRYLHGDLGICRDLRPLHGLRSLPSLSNQRGARIR